MTVTAAEALARHTAEPTTRFQWPVEVVSTEEAHRRFDACIDHSPLGPEGAPLAVIITRVDLPFIR